MPSIISEKSVQLEVEVFKNKNMKRLSKCHLPQNGILFENNKSADKIDKMYELKSVKIQTKKNKNK